MTPGASIRAPVQDLAQLGQPEAHQGAWGLSAQPPAVCDHPDSGGSLRCFPCRKPGYWLQKDALRSIPIRPPLFRQGCAEDPWAND